MLRYLLCLIGLTFLIYTAATAVTQVQPGERAVVRRFGRIVQTQPEPGLYIGWPWGIERVDRVPVGLVRRITVGFLDRDEKEDEAVPAGQMLTGDHNLVNVQAEIFYKVRADRVEKFVLQANNVDALVARTAESILAEWSAGRKVDDVLRRGKIELPVFLRDQLQERLNDYDVGLDVEQTSVTKLFPPEQVKEAFDLVAQAQTNIDTQINMAKEEAKRSESVAKGEEYRMQRLAQAYANAERINAEAAADSFRKRLDQYRELARTNPDYLNALWLDDMTRLFAGMKESGRLGLLDHYLNSEGLGITQFPLQSKKR